MKKVTSQQRSGVLLGVFVGVVVGFVVGGVSSDWVILAGAKWWEVMVGIGTIGTVVVALFFGLREMMKQAKETTHRSEFLQNAINNEVERIAGDLALVLGFLTYVYGGDALVDPHRAHRVRNEVHDLSTPIIDNLRLSLIDLPLDRGALAVDLSGQIVSLKEKLGRLLGVFEGEEIPTETRSLNYKIALVSVIQDICTAGLQACYLRQDVERVGLYQDLFLKEQAQYTFEKLN